MRLPRRLRSRLVVSHLVVALATLGTVLVAVSLVGPGYFAEAMGHQPGDPEGLAMDAATLAAFQEAIRTALVAALAIALVAAVISALALSARIATPVTRLVAAARRIAAGHYAERVPVSAEGEIGELAETFNAMAGSLEATERRRLELVGDVAHELRTPLATLDGYLEGLEDGVVAPGPGTWALLRGETGRLTRLVDDLSELWRAEARQLPLAIADVDLTAVARDVIASIRPAWDERGIGISLDAPGTVAARADRDRVAQILRNYLTNAIRYSPDRTPVTVAIQASGDEVLVSVRDLGPGLGPEQLSRVFERFYRIDPSRSRALGGSGIGLAIAGALAAAMGGRAWAESDGPGTGSTFLLALPRA
jgi:two-component system, OmpR family, sensor histidine kinase BaeS